MGALSVSGSGVAWQARVMEPSVLNPCTNGLSGGLRLCEFASKHPDAGGLKCWVWAIPSREPGAKVSIKERSHWRTVHHTVVHRLLTETTRLSPHQLVMERGRYGKPRLVARPSLGLSISHSEHYGGLALADGYEIGFDLECTSWVDFRGVARRFFPFEAQQLERDFAVSKSDHRFLQAWTAKESYLKALGIGLSKPLGSFRLRLDDHGRAIELLHCTDFGAPFGRCSFLSLPVDDRYAATVVSIRIA